MRYASSCAGKPVAMGGEGDGTLDAVPTWCLGPLWIRGMDNSPSLSLNCQFPTVLSIKILPVSTTTYYKLVFIWWMQFDHDIYNILLGGGFKCFLFSSLAENMIQFDEHIFSNGLIPSPQNGSFQQALIGFEPNPPKISIDTQNDGFWNVFPFKYGCFGYPMLNFWGCCRFFTIVLFFLWSAVWFPAVNPLQHKGGLPPMIDRHNKFLRIPPKLTEQWKNAWYPWLFTM